MARRLFYLSIVQSTLEFASSAYVHCLTSTLFQKLIVCSHLCMKKIFNLNHLNPTSIVLKHGSLYSLEQRFDYQLINLVYRCLNSLASPFCRRFLFYVAHHTERTPSHEVKLMHHYVCPMYPQTMRMSKRSISLPAAARWNQLPSEILLIFYCLYQAVPTDRSLSTGYPK